jgi:predicted ATP-dependent endonuclease of OLD family
MRIKRISVEGLFGKFDRVIPLNMDDRITIVHAPNGFGKTIIMEMLNGFFNADMRVFEKTPFSKFIVELEDNLKIEIVGDIEESKALLRKGMTCNFYKGDSLETSSYLSHVLQVMREDSPRAEEEKNISNIQSGIVVSGDNNVIYYGAQDDYLRNTMIITDEPSTMNQGSFVINGSEALKNLSAESSEIKNILITRPSVYLIKSQRLLRTSSNPRTNRNAKLVVMSVADELAEIMRSKFNEYGRKAQDLDRTFPRRSVQGQSILATLTNEDLREHLYGLDSRRHRLIAVGLLDKGEEEGFQLPEQIEDSTKNILAIYANDTEEKFNVFNEILEKLELFADIINSKFVFSGKRVNFSKEKGLIVSSYLDHSGTSELGLHDLSSGEQHELILIYELLFKVEINSLVLIDEPEISLHVGWQVDFLKDLQRVLRLVNIDILIATHAPSIIHERWDLTIELPGMAK